MKKVIKIILIVVASFVGLILIIGIILAIFSPDSSKITSNGNRKVGSVIHAINMDSLELAVKKDTLFGVMDVFYNKIDSTFSIAISNKFNVLKNKDYSVEAFDNGYHIDSLPEVDGINLYAWKKGKSLSKGDYANLTTLDADSKRWGMLLDYFNNKYWDKYMMIYKPLYDYLHDNLNDPSSLDIVRSFKATININDDLTFHCKTVFRAKNAFGALVLQTADCDIDTAGNVTNVQMNE